LADCENGNYGKGIATLERLVTDAKMTLPPRGY
jgi:hypothetical protein